MTIQVINNIHRRVLPFTLSFRLLSLTTAPSLAAFVQVNTAYAQDQKATVVVAERLSVNELLSATNSAREAAGIPALTVNTKLNTAAAAKLRDMQANGYWDHYRPSDHKAPWAFMEEAGYAYKVAGENLARGFRTAEGITEAWLNSPAHRANLLSAKYTEVGFADAMVIQADGTKVLYTVQMFGGQ
jgi:uncharacterized protein YkwD